jgi:hypothetical protein
MENSVAACPPCLKREKEEIEFVTVTQCSFKCKKNSKQKKEQIQVNIFHLVAAFIYVVKCLIMYLYCRDFIS